LNRILMLRSQGRRISSIQEVFPNMGQPAQPAGRGGRPIAGQVQSQALIAQLQGRSTVTTNFVELVITARVGPQAPPTKLIAVVQRVGTGPNSTASIQNLVW